MRAIIPIFFIIFILIPTASAHIDHHRLLKVEANITIKAYYSGISQIPVSNATVKVYKDEALFIEGKTDEEGKFSFKPEGSGSYKIVVEQNHHRATLNFGQNPYKSGDENLRMAFLLSLLGYAVIIAITIPKLRKR